MLYTTAIVSSENLYWHNEYEVFITWPTPWIVLSWATVQIHINQYIFSAVILPIQIIYTQTYSVEKEIWN